MQIQQILSALNGASIIHIDTETIVDLLGGKANPQVNNVKKVTISTKAIIFSNAKSNGYENMVKRRLAKEGKDPEAFFLQPRKWGTRIPGTPFVEHKGNTYLEVIIITPGEKHFVYQNKIIDEKDIVGKKPQSSGEQGGLEDKVVIACYNIHNITGIRAFGHDEVLSKLSTDIEKIVNKE